MTIVGSSLYCREGSDMSWHQPSLLLGRCEKNAPSAFGHHVCSAETEWPVV